MGCAEHASRSTGRILATYRVPEDLSRLVAGLRSAGSDTAVEVKSARGGLPEPLTSTLSALANHPGGGLVLLGIDEDEGLRPVNLRDRQALKQALGSKARSFVPPVRLTIENAVVDGTTVIAATVHECDPSAKPCRAAASGAAYLRSYDGDCAMSDLEAQGFLATRRPPHFDRAPVDGTTRDDLDPDLLANWATAVQARSPHTLGRFEGPELLRRAGMLTDAGTATVAGLLALGKYPQQWLPRYVVQAAVAPFPGDPPGTRAHDLVALDGPVPRMLDGAMSWARRNLSTRVVAGPDGTVHDAPELPMEAFREVISNALIHRDLDAWSEPMAVELRLLPRQPTSGERYASCGTATGSSTRSVAEAGPPPTGGPRGRHGRARQGGKPDGAGAPRAVRRRDGEPPVAPGHGDRQPLGGRPRDAFRRPAQHGSVLRPVCHARDRSHIANCSASVGGHYRRPCWRSYAGGEHHMSGTAGARAATAPLLRAARRPEGPTP
jgi:hypothetical protein